MLRPRILLLAIVLCAVPQTTHAAVTTYTTQASFLADVETGYYLETFNSLPPPAPPQDLGNGPLPFSGNGFSYSASATNGFFSAGSVADVWLSTNTATDSIVFNFTTPITAVGGNFFTSDINGLFAAGDITLQLVDGSSVPPEGPFATATSTFRGFISTQTITSLTVTATQPAVGFRWPTVNDLIVGNAADDNGGGGGGSGSSTVPEPTTIAVFGLMGVAGFVARRRKLARV